MGIYVTCEMGDITSHDGFGVVEGETLVDQNLKKFKFSLQMNSELLDFEAICAWGEMDGSEFSKKEVEAMGGRRLPPEGAEAPEIVWLDPTPAVAEEEGVAEP